MAEQNKMHFISKNKFHIILGIFLCLISISLMINVGFIAHLLSYPFLLLFGVGSYLCYVLIYIYGMWLIFHRKKGVFKHKTLYFVIPILFFALILLISFVSYRSTGKNVINIFDVFKMIPNGYLQTKFINLFNGEYPFGGGVIGNAITTLTNNVNDGFTIFIIIILLLTGLIFLFFKYVNILFHKIIKKPLPTSFEENFEDDISLTDNQPLKSQEDNASFNNNSENPSYDVPHTDFVNPLPQENSPFIPFDNTGVIFAKPVFNAHNDSSNSSINEVKNDEMINENIIAPSLEENVEQMELDFSAKPEYNQELLTKKIEFEDPIVKNDSSFNEEKEVETPIKEVPQQLEWIPPSNKLLNIYENSADNEMNIQAAEERKAKINEILSSFHVNVTCRDYVVGPSVTRYHIEYNADVSVRNVSNIVQDISVRLGGLYARFESVVEGQSYSGLEIPNVKATMVGFKEAFDALPDVEKHPLAVVFGKNISGKIVSADLNEFPHLLVAGTTGSGKSVYVHSIISTLIMRVSPYELKIVLVDPKKVEMTKYKDMPHLLCPIITDASKTKVMLDKMVEEMDNRYGLFEHAESCSNIKEYNQWAKENNQPKMPYILVVLDEYADLIDSCKEISQPVVSIAQKARAAGIHLVISTQRPSTNVITGVIKGNLPTRVALMTASSVDSVTIVGEGGAEKLLGNGDMLVSSALLTRVGLCRLQGCYINGKEINRVVGYLKEHYPTNYDPNFMDLVDHSKETAKMEIDSGNLDLQSEDSFENKYQSVKQWVMCMEYISMSKIQRECGVGFNRAGLMIKRLISEGIISEFSEGNKGNKVLIKDKFSNAGTSEVNSSELSSLSSENKDGE